MKVPRGVGANPVDVSAYSKNGVGVLRRAYRYVADVRISAISPLTGPLSEEAAIALTGTGFSGATSVNFGAIQATNLVVVSDTQLTAVTPAGATLERLRSPSPPSGSWTVKNGFT